MQRPYDCPVYRTFVSPQAALGVLITLTVLVVLSAGATNGPRAAGLNQDAVGGR